MCCKLDDRLVSADPGCLAFCQAVVSSLGVTHADCLALPMEQQGEEPLRIVGAGSGGGGGGANGDSPGGGLTGSSSSGGLNSGGGGGFEPITPRSPLGKAAANNNGPGGIGLAGRYVPLLAVWAVLRPAFPLGHDGGIREAMEAGTRAARFLVRSAQDEARLSSTSSTPGGGQQRRGGVQTQTSAGKPWSCGEWVQCRSSNGVEVQTAFLQSLAERLADAASGGGGGGGGSQQRPALGRGHSNSGKAGGGQPTSAAAAAVAAATSLSTPQTEPSPASTTHASPQVPGSAGVGAAGRPGSDEERLNTGGGGAGAMGPYGS